MLFRSRVREARGGKLNDPRFGSRMEGAGPYADAAYALFEKTCKKLGLRHGHMGDDADDTRAPPKASTFARPPRAPKSGDQMKLF